VAVQLGVELASGWMQSKCPSCHLHHHVTLLSPYTEKFGQSVEKIHNNVVTSSVVCNQKK